MLSFYKLKCLHFELHGFLILFKEHSKTGSVEVLIEVSICISCGFFVLISRVFVDHSKRGHLDFTEIEEAFLAGLFFFSFLR